MLSGEEFAKLRERLGFKSQTALSEASGIGKSTINEIENGKKEIPKSVIEFLVTKYSVNANYLIFGKGEIFLYPETIGKRLALVRRTIGWDRTQISNMMTVDPEDYAKWEDDIEEPEYDALRRLEGNTLYSRSWILTGKDPMQITPDQIQKRPPKENIPQESFEILFPGVYKMYLENKSLKNKVDILSEIENEYCQLDQTKKVMTKAYIQALFDQQKQQ